MKELPAFDIVPFRLPMSWLTTIDNPQLSKLLQIENGDVSLRSLWRRVPHKTRRACSSQLRRLGSGATRLELLLPVKGSDGVERDFLVRARLIKTSSGRELDGIAADLSSELKPYTDAITQAESRADTAVQELNHRVRNIMSVVTALITLSSRFAEDVESFSASTLARIQALNVAYSSTGIDPSNPHLIRSVVEMEELAGGILSRFRTENGQLTFCKQPLELSPGQASAVGLILHELASNARDHGGLSNPDGHVELFWRKRGRHFEVRWDEFSKSLRQDGFVDGFGMTIVKLFARNYLNGNARWEIGDDRLTVHITGVEG